MTHTRVFYEVAGGHVHTNWYSGKAENTTHGHNGSLVFTLEEWETMKRILDSGYTEEIEIIEREAVQS